MRENTEKKNPKYELFSPILENWMNIYFKHNSKFIFIKLSVSLSPNTRTIMNVRILTNIISLILVLFGILVTTVLLHPLYRYVIEEELFRELNYKWNPAEYKIYCKMLLIYVNALRGVWKTWLNIYKGVFVRKQLTNFSR